MLQSALFTYRRRVKSASGEEVYNDNFINPLNVISFYWQLDESGNRVLSVFLTNQYTVTFGEKVGERFVNHMEDFLRYMLNAVTAVTTPQGHQHTGPRTARKAIAAEVIDEEPVPQAATWEG